MTLQGKTAIVTGGNSGIGLSIVLELAKQGANIVIDYVVHPETAVALEQQVLALGDRAIHVQADVSKTADLQKLVDAAVSSFGRLDIIVNNAGVETRTSSPLRITRGKDFQSLNVRGLYPAGEGAGYAGGIMSAGVDGIEVAEALGAQMLAGAG